MLGVPPHPVVGRPFIVGELKRCDDADSTDRNVDALPGQLGRHSVPLFGRALELKVVADHPRGGLDRRCRLPCPVPGGMAADVEVVLLALVIAFVG